jgi:uncharacterized hydrophobic protein (TIGR00271 family)
MSVTAVDVDRMTDALFIQGPWSSRSSSRFWVLLVLAAVIATAGVIADSTATVIGAMIVAPLMTPILGTALAVVLADRTHVVRSVGLVIGGALLVIAIGFVFGWIGAPADAFASNSQVTSRISPGLIDLVAALATGTVGAFALVRSDISDTLPGVAIAISLVPPLAVVGLLLSVQRYGDATGALLLFGTNVAAIIATGTAVLLIYKVRAAAEASGRYAVGALKGRTLLTVVALLVLVSIPLAIGTYSVALDQLLASKARPVAQKWAGEQRWQVADVTVRDGRIRIVALGPPPDADVSSLRKDLNDAGMRSSDLTVELVVGGSASCPANGEVCSTLS